MSWKILYWIGAVILLLPLVNLVLGVHPPRFKTNDDPGRYGIAYEDVSFSTDDGLTLRGWFIPAARTARSVVREGQAAGCATILVGHGYPFDKANILRHSLFLRGRFNLLLLDFRYFGESDGAYTTAGLAETRDVAAAVDYLGRRADLDRSRIGAMGFSMSAATFILARHPQIRAIVADSPYASLRGMVERQFFFLPGPLKWPFVTLTEAYVWLFLGLRMSEAAPAEAVRTLQVPLLVIHGEEDSQIPLEHAQRIAANAPPGRTELWRVPDADHGLAHALAGPEYEMRVRLFFERHLCPDNGT